MIKSCPFMLLPITLALLAGLWSPIPAHAAEEAIPAFQARLSDQALILGLWQGEDALVAVGDHGIILRGASADRLEQVNSPVSSLLTSVAGEGNRVFAAGHDGVILLSNDSGQSWELVHRDIDRQSPIFGLHLRENGEVLAYGAYGLLMHSEDGRNWEEAVVDEEEPHLYGMAESAGSLWLAGEYGGLYRSDDGGLVWEALATPYDGSWFGIVAVDDATLVAYGLRGNCWYSQDGGKEWSQLETTSRSALMSHAIVGGELWIGGLAGTLLRGNPASGQLRLVPLPNRLGLAALLPAAGKLLLAGEGGIRSQPMN